MKQDKTTIQTFLPFHSIDFSKASPEAIDAILNALNAEVVEAILMNRIPLLEHALQRLWSSKNSPALI